MRAMMLHGQTMPRATAPPVRSLTAASPAVTRRVKALSSTRQAGPASPEPSYAEIDSQPLNQVVMSLFRRKMVAALGTDSQMQGYDAIIDLTRQLNVKFDTSRETQLATRGILNSLFPSWLPGAFKVMFSGPLPDLSCRLNAWATALTCQWLMGTCKVNDVERSDGSVAEGMGVLVERCRYLEQAGCASICINSCKVPTQEFFIKDMGLPLTMTPNYEDFSCQFSFGVTPPPVEQDEAFTTPCFLQCPSKARRYLADVGPEGKQGEQGPAATAGSSASGVNCPNIPV